jgi:hypothetical protein
MRADKSKGILRKVNIIVKSEGAHEGFQSHRGGRLGLAYRTPSALPLTPSDDYGVRPRRPLDYRPDEQEPRSSHYNHRRIA